MTDKQCERIREHIPDGRLSWIPVPIRPVFEVVLWIMNVGARWDMLPERSLLI